MLRKLIVFAIASGLAKKTFDAYRARQRTIATGTDETLPSTPSRLLGPASLNSGKGSTVR
jgi:hypothetical protein